MWIIALTVIVWLASRWVSQSQRAVKDHSDLQAKTAQIAELIGVLAIKTGAVAIVLPSW